MQNKKNCNLVRIKTYKNYENVKKKKWTIKNYLNFLYFINDKIHFKWTVKISELKNFTNSFTIFKIL